MAEGSRPAARALLAVVAIATAWSAIRPADWGTWFFELFLGAAGIAVLLVVSRRYRFSWLIYAMAAAHYVILAVGAKYTYAGEPFFSWLRDLGLFSRNHFDRVGHFAQGLTPALLARELLVRRVERIPSRLAAFLAVCVGLAFSAFYELVEWWWVLAFYPTAGPEWLGMQGDPWDAQGDMMMALCGALVAVVALRRPHDAAISRLEAGGVG